MGHVIARMADQGRIRYVECKPGKRYVYEVTNPNTYNRLDRSTHAQRRTKPAWG